MRITSHQIHTMHLMKKGWQIHRLASQKNGHFSSRSEIVTIRHYTIDAMLRSGLIEETEQKAGHIRYGLTAIGEKLLQAWESIRTDAQLEAWQMLVKTS